ncbi:MAG: tetratricopeptide repeat protein [Phycisphaeraceae bacterium]|nr:tetratricopeptide repeat protein [Phycisphaeraceae bacterium]
MAANQAMSDTVAEIRDTDTARKYLEIATRAQEQGERIRAIEALEAAFAADPDDGEVCFRLAYLLDLAGEEDEAIHLFEQCAQQPQPPLNALVNLAVLYEDRGQYSQAERCLRQVLATEPNHPRARLYIKDVLAAREMVIEEEPGLRGARGEQPLDTPVTDFDLSVRTRNSLRKMNIRTLSDLLQYTEAGLRQFKNFGDASLEEIKAMLAQKGLKLGQLASQQQTPAAEEGQQAEDAGENEVYGHSVNELQLSVRARKALNLLNVQTIGDLCGKTEAELMGVKNFGQTSLVEIKEKLGERGLSLRELDE